MQQTSKNHTEYSQIVQAIQDAVKMASAMPYHPEAKLRELVEPLWEQYFRTNHINLNFQPRNERAFANGRADTVYNRLIIEYKKPNAIKADNAKNRQLISQLKGYIEDLAKEERWKEDRLLGVAFDGKYFLYISKVGRWIEEEPVAVSVQNVEHFLLTLEKLTSKAALVPENLIRDFAVGAGSLNYIASNAIKAFYFALTSNVDARVKVFFEQWATQFAKAHGAIEDKRFDAETLFASYGFKKQEQKAFDFKAFFFALDTYYGLLMKLLAYQVVGFYTLKNLSGLPLSDWKTLDADALKDKLTELEDGGIFHALEIRNFLEGDLLSWYLNDWNNAIEQATRAIVERLNQYDPESLELMPDQTRDILQKPYQVRVPKQIRHDLGELYTPDWLAERALNQLGYGDKDRELLTKRLLDPGCGSGTFVILAIKRARENARLYNIDPAETLKLITANIVGFDINPLAVISARTNYLLAIADLLKFRRGEVTVPIYLCDSINPPRAKEQASLFDDPEGGIYEITTSVEGFRFPQALVQRDLIGLATNLLEDSVKRGLSREKFMARAQADLKTPDNRVLAETYEKLLELERKGINGVWARIIKNAFAPLFCGTFDYIAGNPPWVNWEDLPQTYRDSTKALWQNYGLFSLSGQEARLGGGKKDISMLMLYVAIDKYLKDNCKLCFVITQTLFKTQGAGDGFRRFRLGPTGPFFKVEQLVDMVELQPFEGATNRTALVLCKKGEKTNYPVPYLLWRKKTKCKIELDYTIEEASNATVRYNLKAQPIGDSETSPWMSAKPRALQAIQNVIGQAAYTAVAGSCTWLNGVYWGSVKPSKNGLIKFSNLFDEGKIKVESVEEEIEPILVFPLLRGREVKRWKSEPESFIIVSQDPKQRRGYELKWMEKHVPKTLAYFNRFKPKLVGRSGYKKYLEGYTFYSIYNVSENTFAPYKVVWSEVGNVVEAAVVGSYKSDCLGEKIIVPDHTVVGISFENETEAHFVCAMLNSNPSQFIVRGYVVLHPSPHVLKNIKVPKFDPKNELHEDLSRLSKQCHEKAAAGIDVNELEEQIDELAAELWGLTKEELEEIKESLEELQ